MNNSKILLSSIAISILCSVSLEANVNCDTITNQNASSVGNSCTLSNVNKNNGRYNIYYGDSTNRSITDKKIIIFFHFFAIIQTKFI